MMKELYKKAITAGILFLLILSLAGCKKKASLSGTWTGDDQGVALTYVFNGDGTGSCEESGRTLDITYTVDDSNTHLYVSTTEPNQLDSQTFLYTVTDDTLQLTSEGATAQFTRQ